MYRPELENLTSDIDDIISEKKLRLVGSSGSSNTKKQARKNYEIVNAGAIVVVSIFWRDFAAIGAVFTARFEGVYLRLLLKGTKDLTLVGPDLPSRFSEQQKQVRFQQTHNQGLRQLFLSGSWDLRA